MFDFFRALFGTDFMPHLYCLRSDPGVLWLGAVSNLATAAAYRNPLVMGLLELMTTVGFYSACVALYKLQAAYRDRMFRRVAALTIVFFFLCGTSRVTAVWMAGFAWGEDANLAVVVFRGLFSLATAFVLIRMLPTIQKLPSHAELQEEIEERKRIELKLRATMERLASIIDNVREYAIYSLDPGGKVKTWDIGAERLKGYTAEEIVGRHFSCFYSPEEVARGVPELALRTAIETGRYEAQGWRYRKDGSRFWAHVILRPLYDTSGVLVRLIKVTHDLTESRETESRFQALLQSAPDAILIIDRNSTIEFLNDEAERLFGYPRAELLGQPIGILDPERFRAEREKLRAQFFHELKHAQAGADGQFFVLRKDGKEVQVELTISPVETRDGWVLLSAIRDLTERVQAETRFRELLEATPDAIVIVDAAGGIQFVNEKSVRLFGYERTELLGQPVKMLVPERAQPTQENYRERLLSGVSHPAPDAPPEIFGLRKDGTEFPVEFSVSPLETREGRVLLFAVRDLTDRLKAETRFRELLEAAPDAILIIGRDSRIEYANLEAELLFGYPRSEFLGESIGMLAPGWAREERAAMRERLFGERKRVQVGSDGSFPVKRKDGSEFPVEFTLNPLETPNGWVFLLAIRDISERLRTETRFRALLDSAPDAMVIVNSAGAVELANLQTERLFGYRRSELLGQSVDILVPEGLRVIHGEHRKRFFQDPRQREMGRGLELMAVRCDRTQFPVEISLSPLEGPNGTSVTAAIRDISERKWAAQQLSEKMDELRQSNEALEQFAHIASHDLQEPLRMVASFTQLLSKRYKGRLDADADEFIGYAVDGTQRMKRLIEDLLMYSRAGRSVPPAKELRSEDALREALGNLKAGMEESGAQVTWDALPQVTAAELQLVQLFQNLVGNAIKYRGDRVPQIHVSAQSTETEWIFSVADNGIGIERKYFDRVFVIFQRLHGRGEYEGTGIGLAICKRILQQQGGRIWLESEPGVGSKFYFSLPVR